MLLRRKSEYQDDLRRWKRLGNVEVKKRNLRGRQAWWNGVEKEATSYFYGTESPGSKILVAEPDTAVCRITLTKHFLHIPFTCFRYSPLELCLFASGMLTLGSVILRHRAEPPQSQHPLILEQAEVSASK